MEMGRSGTQLQRIAIGWCQTTKGRDYAELNMARIINELTAAAIAHGLNKSAMSWAATWEEVFSTCPCEPSKMHV